DHDAVRPQGVLDGGALAEELGVGDDVEVDRTGLGPGDHLPDELAGAHRDGGLVHDHLVAVHGVADLRGHRLHVGEIRLAGLLGRGAHRDEDDVRVLDRAGQVGGEGEPSVVTVPDHHFFEPGLVDGHPPPPERLDLGVIVVHADHAVAEIGEDRAGHQPHVTGSHHADVHSVRPPDGASDYQTTHPA